MIEVTVDTEFDYDPRMKKFFLSHGFDLDNTPENDETQMEFDRIEQLWEEYNWEPNTDHPCV